MLPLSQLFYTLVCLRMKDVPTNVNKEMASTTKTDEQIQEAKVAFWLHWGSRKNNKNIKSDLGISVYLINLVQIICINNQSQP